MKKLTWVACCTLAIGGLTTGACGSDDDDDNGSGSGSGGSSSVTTTTTNTSNGTSNGTGNGTSNGTSNSTTNGSTTGSGGTGSGGTGAGGAAGMAGMAGAAGDTSCPDEPPLTEHNSCADIPSANEGDEDFTISSPDFEFCGEMPADLTCDGKAFGTGSSPELEWSGAPEGTNSFAIVFKDIAILADNDPATERFAYHWVMWDIPADVTGLPAGMMGGYESTEIDGALQWASRNEYGFFPPCPNPFPADDERFSCGLVTDSYSFTLYALPMATLQDLPDADIDSDTGMPTGNWVVNMGHYIESLNALAVTEYRGTSSAWATSFAPPDPVLYPCTGGSPDGTDCLEPQ